MSDELHGMSSPSTIQNFIKIDVFKIALGSTVDADLENRSTYSFWFFPVESLVFVWLNFSQFHNHAQ